MSLKAEYQLWEEDDDPKLATPSIKLERPQIAHSGNSWKFIITYHIIFWSGGAYGLYNFFLLSKKWKKNLDLVEGPSLFGTHQDQNDLEWRIFIPLLMYCAPYGILHLILVQATRHFFPSLLQVLYVIFSTVMLMKVLGLLGTTLCYTIPIVMFIALLTRIRSLIWLMWCSILIVFNCSFFQAFLEKAMNDNGEGEYKTSVIVAWIMLRCISFCLVTCAEDPDRKKPMVPYFVNILAYSLYFPNLITGPFMSYKKYRDGVNKPFEPWTLDKAIWFVLQCCRFLFWLCLADTLLYYFYAHSLIFNANYIENFDSWTMVGYYSFILIFFFLKYVVMYGLPSVLARAEGYEPPDPPKCILLIRRYSDIWRYFDIGLHTFIIDHIYVPFLGEDASFFKQIQGSVVAFTFIYVWHGAYPSVLWWCVINFHFTILEKVVDKWVDTPFYMDWERKLLPESVAVVLRRIATGFFLSLSMNSLIIFLTSLEHAQKVFQNIYVKGFPITTLSTIFFFSLMAQGGMDLYNYRMRKKIKKR